jgi:hypothetical protein
MEVDDMAGVTPCYQCTDRDPYCHCTCQKYKDWKDLREAEKAEQRKHENHLGWTYAQKKAYWAAKRRDPYKKSTKKFSQ